MININTFSLKQCCTTLRTYTKKMHVYAQKGNKRANIIKTSEIYKGYFVISKRVHKNISAKRKYQTSEIYKVYFVISKRMHKILAQSAPIFYKATYKTNYSLGLAPHLFSPGWLSWQNQMRRIIAPTIGIRISRYVHPLLPIS